MIIGVVNTSKWLKLHMYNEYIILRGTLITQHCSLKRISLNLRIYMYLLYSVNLYVPNMCTLFSNLSCFCNVKLLTIFNRPIMLQKEGTLRRQTYKLVARALWWSCHLWLDFVSWSYGYHFRRQIDAITIIKRLKGNRSIKMTLTLQNVMHENIHPININTKTVTKNIHRPFLRPSVCPFSIKY